jgi:UPF0042 nucleotide-binding protein
MSAEVKQLVVVTGLSGSGKSTVAKSFEDLGFYCVDNLPLPLLREFLSRASELTDGHDRIAVVTDARAPGFAAEFPRMMSEVGQGDIRPTLLFLEADEGTLVRRFSETRRTHPLAGEGHVLEGIRIERELLAEIRGAADLVLDTSEWTVHDTRSQIFDEFADRTDEQLRPIVSLVSFGFKHGLPAGTDLLFDVRFLANPYFEDGLRELSGKDAAVRHFLEGLDEYEELLTRLTDLLEFVLPRYRRENRSYLSIAVGCTGGRHRSVCVAEDLAVRIREAGWSGRVFHRDIER